MTDLNETSCTDEDCHCKNPETPKTHTISAKAGEIIITAVIILYFITGIVGFHHAYTLGQSNAELVCESGSAIYLGSSRSFDNPEWHLVSPNQYDAINESIWIEDTITIRCDN